MNVLFISSTDWCNLGYHFSQSLNSVGVTSHSAYQNDNTIGPKGIHFKKYDKIGELIEEADAIIINHTKSPISMDKIKEKILDKGKKFLVLHGGSAYRQNVEKYNNMYNGIVDATLNFHDISGRGAKNEKLVVAPIDTDLLQPVYHHRDKLTVANYPTQYATRPLAKGRDIIVKAMEEMNVDDRFIFKGETNIIDCDIYIENVNTKQKGVPLTMFGVVAAEAASLGKIVIGHFCHYEEFERDFGICRIQSVYDGESLKEKINWLLSLSKEEILKLQKESREWAVQCHSYKAVGTRLKNIIEEL